MKKQKSRMVRSGEIERRENVGIFKTSRGHSTTRRRRRLRKEIRETITIALIGTALAFLLVGAWIGSVIQTSERLSEMSMEVMG